MFVKLYDLTIFFLRTQFDVWEEVLMNSSWFQYVLKLENIDGIFLFWKLVYYKIFPDELPISDITLILNS